MQSHPLETALVSNFRERHSKGIVRLRREEPQTAEGREAQQHAQAERIALAADELATQQWRDSLAVVEIGQIILNAEADAAEIPRKLFLEHEQARRQDVQADAAISLRIRRPEWRRLAQRAVTATLEAGLAELASDAMGPERRHALAVYLTGQALNAAVETYSGKLPVTPSQFAAALLDVEHA